MKASIELPNIEGWEGYGVQGVMKFNTLRDEFVADAVDGLDVFFADFFT